MLVALMLLACNPDNITASDLANDTSGADEDGDGFGVGVDCNDEDDSIFPGAAESCDGVDQDCDDNVDESAADADAYYPDTDGDGFGDPASVRYSCEALDDHVTDNTDCDDTDSAVNPSATEVCDDADVDEDCDGLVNDGDDSVDTNTSITTYQDADGDGYGNPDVSEERCSTTSEWITDNTDCDDGNPLATPENECDVGWQGVWSGEVSVESVTDFLTDTCTGSASVEVNDANVPVLTGTYSCTWATLTSTETVTQDGEYASEDEIAGNMTVGSLTGIEYTGTFNADGDMELSGTGTASVGGFSEAQYTVTGTLSR